MAYSHSEIIAILNYAKEHGPHEAAKHFRVAISSVTRWNNIHKIYDTPPRHRYTTEEKIEILEYVKTNGLMQTSVKYNISESTLSLWNSKLNIYPKSHHLNPNKTDRQKRTSPKEQRKILAYAKQNGIPAATEKYNVSAKLISAWNHKQKVLPYNEYNIRADEEKDEIIEYAKQHSITKAARKFKTNYVTIRYWLIKGNQK